jgi:serine/threonine protein kinase
MFNVDQKIGPYTLIRRLGKGGFGEVWLAEKRSQFVNKKVAVKLPHDEQVDFDAIRKEATLWEQASGHANVLPIIDADIYDGQVVIVSEYADGGTLADRLKTEGIFHLEQAVEMVLGILNGLEYLHNKDIIHRDIKPQNILLQGETPRLADFGISRAMQATHTSSAIMGTDAYMAPEAFRGKRSVQTDIWSVGVILYLLIKGQLPFTPENPSERMYSILNDDLAPIPESVPAFFQQIIRKALAKNPENRYETARQMSADLKNALNLLPASSAAAGIIDDSETPTVVRPRERNTQSWMGNGLILGAFLTFAVFILGAGGFWGWSYLKGKNGDDDKNINSNSVASLNNRNKNPENPTNVNSGNMSTNSESLTNTNSNINGNTNANAANTNIAPLRQSEKAQLQQVMNQYLAGVAKVSGRADEPKEFRQVVYGDIDGDGDNDAVVRFTLEGADGSNNWSLNIAVFRNNEGKFESVTDDVVGGKGWRNFSLESVGNKGITGTVDACNVKEFQRPCFTDEKPEIKRRITISFKDNKLSVPSKP